MIVVGYIYQTVTNASSNPVEVMYEDAISNTDVIPVLPAPNYEPMLELEENTDYFIVQIVNEYVVQFKRRKLTSCHIRAPDGKYIMLSGV